MACRRGQSTHCTAAPLRRVLLHYDHDKRREGLCSFHAHDFLVLDVPHSTP
jgi:hypothetical protein